MMYLGMDVQKIYMKAQRFSVESEVESNDAESQIVVSSVSFILPTEFSELDTSSSCTLGMKFSVDLLEVVASHEESGIFRILPFLLKSTEKF